MVAGCERRNRKKKNKVETFLRVENGEGGGFLVVNGRGTMPTSNDSALHVFFSSFFFPFYCFFFVVVFFSGLKYI